MSKVTKFFGPRIEETYENEDRSYNSVLVREKLTTKYIAQVGPLVRAVRAKHDTERVTFVQVEKDMDEQTLAATISKIENGRIIRLLGLTLDSVIEHPYTISVEDEDGNAEPYNEGDNLRQWLKSLERQAATGDKVAAERLSSYKDKLVAKDADGTPILHEQYQMPYFRRIFWHTVPEDDIDKCDEDFAALSDATDDDVAAVTSSREVVTETA